MKKITLPLLAATIGLSTFLTACTTKKDVNSFEAMNTFMTIQCYGSNPAKVNKMVEDRILYIEDLLSTTKEQSDISRINHAEGKTVTVQKETFELVSFAKEMAEKTSGALNPALYPITSAWGFTTGNHHVPENKEILELLTYTDYKKIQLNEADSSIKLEKDMMLDLGAVGKGYAGDMAIALMKSKGVKSAILDLGGNIQTLGKKPDGSVWTIGIKNPWGGNPVAGLRIANKVVITSGGYERYFTGDDNQDYIHIFDGKTGRPADVDIASMSIVCDSGLYGDSLSTALFVMGSKQAVEYWRNHKNFQFIMIKNDGGLIYSDGLKDSINLMVDFPYIQVAE